MTIEIKNINNEVIFQYDGASLKGAKLAVVDLREADLSEFDLRRILIGGL